MFVLYSSAFFLYWSSRVYARSSTLDEVIGLGGILQGQEIPRGPPGRRMKSN